MATTPEQLRKLVKSKKGSLAFAWLADMEHKAGRTADALQWLDTGLQQYPNHVTGWCVKGNILRKQGDAAGSRDCFQKVLELDTFHLSAMLQLAEIHMELAEGENAYFLLQDLKDLDALAPDLPEVPKDLLPSDFSATKSKSTIMDNIFPTQELLVSLDDSFLENSFDDLDGEKPPFELQAELEAALAQTPTQDSSAEEFFPDGPISSDTGVVPLFNTMFGAEDAEPPKPPVLDRITTTPTAQSLLSAVTVNETPTIDSVVDSSLFQEPVSNSSPIVVPEPPAKDLSTAMDELFGDDDVVPPLPTASVAKDESGLLEGVSGALADMFGTDPDELPFDTSSSLDSFSESSENSDSSSGVAKSLDDLFGPGEDDLPVESSSSPFDAPLTSDFSQTLEPAIEEESPFEKASTFAPPSEEGSMGGVSNALDDLFGPEEDDLPIDSNSSFFGSSEDSSELSKLEDSESDELENPFEKAPSFAPPKEESALGGLSNALDDLFGPEEDELPIDSTQSVASSSLFDTPLEASAFTNELATNEIESPFEKALPLDPPATDSAFGGATSSLDDLFGSAEEELPLESSELFTPPDNSFLDSSTNSPQAEESDLIQELHPSSPFVPPILDDDEPMGDLFGPVDAEEDMGGDATMQELGSLLDDALPDTETELPTMAEPGSFGSSVGNAFDDLFGEETIKDDVLVEESSNIFGSVLPEPEEEGAHLDESLAQSLIEDPTKPFQEQENTPEKDDVSTAFDSLFGEDDEYIEEESLQATQPTLTLAEVYETQGHLEQALQVYMSLQEKDPSTPGIAEKIESIKSRLG